ncbi:MAG: hypothetical protein P4L36_13955 [Holophaga sp.]|nr:hypothetical protein [Holophaga sp.]
MKVLLLDTAFAAAPIFNYLRDAGHEVWVMGNRPDDLLAKKAEARWIDQDYSDTERVARIIKALGIERVVPGCTDVSIETCLSLGLNQYLVDSPATNHTLSNKGAFRKLCAQLDLPAPRTIAKEAFPKIGRFICKPVDAFSGRGITVFNGENPQELETACAIARKGSPTSSILIETFANGDLYSCSGFVVDRRLTDVFYVLEGSSANPFAVDTSYVVHDLPVSCTRELEMGLEKLCSALQLKDGLLHTQFIIEGGRPSIVEVARRCPGDLYSLLVEYSTGFEYAAHYASFFIGAEHRSATTERRHVLRHTVTSEDRSIYEGLRFVEPRPIRAFFSLQRVGQELLARQGNRAGILFTESPTHEQLCLDYQRCLDRTFYDVAW